MKKIYFLIIIMIMGLSSGFAQNNYSYYYKGKKIPLNINKEYLNITVTNQFNADEVKSLGFEIMGTVSAATKETAQVIKVHFTNSPSEIEYYQKLNALRRLGSVNHVSYYIERGHDTEPIGVSSVFYVKLKSEGDTALLNKVANEKNLTIIKQIPYMPQWYIVTINKNSTENVFDITNYIYETGNFADIDPAFMFDFNKRCTNDPMFGSLWGLNNTSNPNFDINACQAWTITEGNGINVAVLDQGIDVSHNDLNANIGSAGFDSQSGTSPSVFNPSNDHGTHVAGTIAAVKDNNLQVVGVAPQSDLIPVSHNLYISATISAELASGMSWAWQNGADIISNSWGDQGGAYYSNLQSAALENAITNALTLGRGGLGTLVVFAAGNWSPAMDYPGTFHNDITTVGSITSSGARSSFSGYGTKLDVVAPGSSVLSTLPGNSTGYKNGTSMATPHASGTLALILSVNPCLTGAQARDILESTCQKITVSYGTTAGRPNGTWSTQMGYGLIDAYAAVQQAQSSAASSYDLYVKDSSTPFDNGDEPNNVTPYMWASPDIWVRVYPDNGLTHQNPDYSPWNTPNTVYVRLKNRGCVATDGTDKLKLYWAKAATSLNWPNAWNGSTYVGGVIMGNQIGTQTIPVMQPGDEIIVPFSWVVPNPADYTSINTEPWHFCLLTRVESINDPMTYTETSDLNGNVKNNNNIAWKNVTVVDTFNNDAPPSGVIGVGNTFEEPKLFALEFRAEQEEPGAPIFQDADVVIRMDGQLMEAWAAGGQAMEGIEFIEGGEDMLIASPEATLPKMLFQPEQYGTLNLQFKFLPDASEKVTYTYHVIQRDVETGRIIGGETYIINRDKPHENGEAVAAEETDYIASVAPNPASNSVTVEYNVTSSDTASIMIIGSYGSQGDKTNYEIDVTKNEVTLDLSKYPSGFYTVALVCNGKIMHTKNLYKK